jgi:hypothetical protein
MVGDYRGICAHPLNCFQFSASIAYDLFFMFQSTDTHEQRNENQDWTSSGSIDL